MTYIYLRALPFLHFVGEYTRILELSKITWPINGIRREIDQFCELLSERSGEEVHYGTPITSIACFSHFVTANTLELGKLVKAATGISSTKRDLLGIIDKANKVLNAYVYHQWGKLPLNAKKVSAADCVAALSTIRHQQKEQTNYSPSWIGRKSSDVSIRPLGQLDDDRTIEELYDEDYIPHGTSQLLYGRFCGFHAAFAGHVDRHQAWMDFQVARLDKYAECLLSNDISCIDRSVMNFHDYCHLQALQAVHAVRACDQ